MPQDIYRIDRNADFAMDEPWFWCFCPIRPQKYMNTTPFLTANFVGGFLLGLVLLGLLILVLSRLTRTQKVSGMGSFIGKVAHRLLLVSAFLYLFRLVLAGILGTAPGLLLVLIPGSVLILIILSPWWLPSVVGGGLSPITNAYTGGGEVEDLKPFYARAVAYRKRGQADDALAEIEEQLKRFPGDSQGLMMLADLQANELADLPSGLSTLDQIVEKPEALPEDVALALQQKVTWQLERLKDPDAARQSLERLVEACPGTQAALTARQQLARLPSDQAMAAKQDPRKIVVVHHEERVGLMSPAAADLGTALPSVPGDDGGEASRLVTHLQEFPDDWSASEQLAQVYERKWNRPDLAADELERLIGVTSASPRQTAQWLNVLADLQLRSPNGSGAARLTLERVGQKFPGTPWADQAESRIRLLGLDQRAKAAPRTIRLGTYEQNIGLKRADSTIPDPAKSVS